MKKLYFLIFCISFHSCSTKQQKTTDNFKTDKQLSTIVNNEFIKIILNQDTITTQVFKKDVNYIFHCKNGKRIYRKKKFKLLPITDSIGLQKAQLIVDYNKELKSNNLIGLSSKIINVNQKKFLFQEEIGKRLIESNLKREGIIVKINYEDSISIATLKGGYLSTEYTIAILDYLKNNMLNDLVFNRTQIESHQSITKKYFKNARPNYFYLNPITNQLEVIVEDLKANKEKILQIEKISLEQKMAKFDPVKKYLNYFTLADSNKLFLKNKNSIIREKIIIPENFLVQLSEGQSINFIETGSIFSYSPFEINGTKEKLVRIYSSDSSGQGLHLIQGNGTSKVNYLEFINQSSFLDSNKNNRRILPSAFTVYGGKVSINNSIFKNLSSEDAVNLFRCKYDFFDSKIENTFSDALDADFSTGKINNSYFINCGNDGVDISGGFLSLTNCYFNNILDKAISAGEESVLNASNCRIENSDMGLISKDLSIADSKNNIFSNCEIAYCAFQKKGEFGPGNITVENDSLIDCSIAHLIETKSKLIINEDSIRVFQDNVIDYLYGKKYGKATVK